MLTWLNFWIVVRINANIGEGVDEESERFNGTEVHPEDNFSKESLKKKIIRERRRSGKKKWITVNCFEKWLEDNKEL